MLRVWVCESVEDDNWQPCDTLHDETFDPDEALTDAIGEMFLQREKTGRPVRIMRGDDVVQEIGR